MAISHRLRIAFLGTPDFAVPTLRALVDARHDIAAVYTQPPRPAGRGQAPRKSPVHAAAQTLGLDVRTPLSLKADDAQSAFAALDLDAGVVAAYGLILPERILKAPRLGCLNVHASLLPRWRGAAPINRAIMAGDPHTGITIMQMDEGLDTGDILRKESLTIGPEMTAGDVHDALAEMGAPAMVETLAALAAGDLVPQPQPSEGVTYAAKISKDEARINWMRPAREIDRLIRGLSPFPGAWFEVERSGKRYRLKALRSRLVDDGVVAGAPGCVLDDKLTVACGQGTLCLLELQREGGKAQAREEFLRGFSLAPGTALS